MYFGSQPGTVLFDGRSASVTSWADGRVQFKMPTSVTGYGPFDVQVSVDSRTSNTLSYTLANPCS